MDRTTRDFNGSTATSLHLLNSTSPSGNDGRPSESTVLLYEAVYYLWLTVPPVLLVLGCFGNVMTIVVMRALRASDSTACLSVYFTALALSDLCLLITSVLTFWPEMAFRVFVNHIHDAVCALSYFVFFVTSMTSPWFLITMTCQRMVSVILPHRVGVVCTVRRAKVVTVILTTIACAVCLQVLLNYRVEGVTDTYSMCHNIDENLAHIFFLIILIVSSIIPFAFLILTNAILIRAVLHSVKMSRSVLRKSDDDRGATKISSMTFTLILTSVAFLVLSIPICISDIYMEEVGFYRGRIQEEDTKAKLALVESAALLTWMSNSCVNFYLYILSGKKFREETRKRFCLACTTQ